MTQQYLNIEKPLFYLITSFLTLSCSSKIICNFLMSIILPILKTMLALLSRSTSSFTSIMRPLLCYISLFLFEYFLLVILQFHFWYRLCKLFLLTSTICLFLLSTMNLKEGKEVEILVITDKQELLLNFTSLFVLLDHVRPSFCIRIPLMLRLVFHLPITFQKSFKTKCNDF